MTLKLRVSPLRAIGSALVCLMITASVWAAPIPRDNPEQMLIQATDQLLDTSKAAREYAMQDPQRYYRQVAEIIEQVIDKEYFARGVMATYASQRQYQALKTDAEKQAFKARVTRFADILQTVLIEKYADALLTFKGDRIDVKAIATSTSHAKKSSLLQTIYDKGGATYKVQYNLHQKSDSLWLINNVIIEGINMGSTYRTQFAEAVENNRGDVDYVIEHWHELMNRPQEKANTNHG
ncbi:ABC transporter substrate-binding protein [Aestuariicella hydrocarbonica]|uniref:ABC transporter substrate-binding protein n=1 Tax=Pseudomaricurvus hydrocarbonicus TaxID=1470433 RepID=A0A9E5MKS2_9GAMM|nr:ABC transporter substrate-binding protein [Aestuariicella hydrocarbonica]NHO65752.1 ABC transporter substrate-binding protein [Aestuariicella hydrocarbonica]